jgi:hypothetical protein
MKNYCSFPLFSGKLFYSNDFLPKEKIHLHIPEGNISHLPLANISPAKRISPTQSVDFIEMRQKAAVTAASCRISPPLP